MDPVGAVAGPLLADALPAAGGQRLEILRGEIARGRSAIRATASHGATGGTAAGLCDGLARAERPPHERRQYLPAPSRRPATYTGNDVPARHRRAPTEKILRIESRRRWCGPGGAPRIFLRIPRP